MTAKTSISPSLQATTLGPEASSPPSDSGSVQAPATCAECQRARSSSTQKRSRRPGPQVVAARPRGARFFVSVMPSDDRRSSTGTSGLVGPTSAGEGTADSPFGRSDLGALDLDRRIERASRAGEETAEAAGAATEAASPCGDSGLRRAVPAKQPCDVSLFEKVLLVD